MDIKKLLYVTIKKHGCYPTYLGLILLFFLQFSCKTDTKKRGYEYFPDMTYSKAYETYDPNTIYLDGKTAQAPVLGTIPREMVPYQYPNSPEGLKLAKLELINPFNPNKNNVSRGKVEFNTFCANCHGFDGKGDGNLFSSGKYPYEPPSLITQDMQKKADGEFYHIITLGSGIMGSFASMIRSEDRWKIILYIKNELFQEEIKK